MSSLLHLSFLPLPESGILAITFLMCNARPNIAPPPLLTQVTHYLHYLQSATHPAVNTAHSDELCAQICCSVPPTPDMDLCTRDASGSGFHFPGSVCSRVTAQPGASPAFIMNTITGGERDHSTRQCRQILELLTGLREISQCPEKAPSRHSPC